MIIFSLLTIYTLIFLSILAVIHIDVFNIRKISNYETVKIDSLSFDKYIKPYKE